MSGREIVSEIVSKLGTPRDYLAELAGFGIILLALLAYLALEQRLAHWLRRLFKRLSRNNDIPE